MDVTVSLVLKIALTIFVTMMALVSIVFFIIVMAEVKGEKKEKKLQKQKDADKYVFDGVPKMNMIDYPDCPCLKCQYFDKETHACLKEDNYAASSNHA